MLFTGASALNLSLGTSFAQGNQYHYVVSIQNKNLPLYAYAVGLLIQASYVLVTCSIFREPMYTEDTNARYHYSDIRVVANGPSIDLEDNDHVRFVHYVHFHPKCQIVGEEENPVWVNDIASIHLSFPFTLNKSTLEEIHFSSDTDPTAEHKRLEDLQTLVTSSSFCHIMGWGKYVENNGSSYLPSAYMLVSTVQLLPLEHCFKYCSLDVRFCLLNDSIVNKLVCAQRHQKQLGGKIPSHFPCAGSEGAPLICYSPVTKSPDIYGTLSYMPNKSCFQVPYLPLLFTKVDIISTYVKSLRTTASRTLWNCQLLLMATLIVNLHYSSMQ